MSDRPTLTVTMGAPGSGKSTWAKENAGDAVVLSADSIRVGAEPAKVFGAMLRAARRALARGQDVIVDACNSRATDRSPWLFLARKKRARSRLVIFDTPAATCRARDGRRRRPVGLVAVYAARLRESMRHVYREGWGEVSKVTLCPICHHYHGPEPGACWADGEEGGEQ